MRLLKLSRNLLPFAGVHILSNGRRFNDLAFARSYAADDNPNMMVGIPVYGPEPALHDYVVQSAGAFDDRRARQRFVVRATLGLRGGSDDGVIEHGVLGDAVAELMAGAPDEYPARYATASPAALLPRAFERQGQLHHQEFLIDEPVAGCGELLRILREVQLRQGLPQRQ